MPARDKLPSKETLHKYFRYEDGELFWRVTSYGRTPDKPAGNTSIHGYRRVKLHQQLMFVHRVIWKMHHGTEPEYLDHIDRTPLNNRIENLREATAHENLLNTGLRKSNTSGYIGVSKHHCNDTWGVHMRIPGMRFNANSMSTVEEAALVYDAMLLLLKRDTAVRNFPDKKPGVLYMRKAYAALEPYKKEIKKILGVSLKPFV